MDKAHVSCGHPSVSNPISSHDSWALSYIGNQHLQQLKEAFDDDNSGSITVIKINRITSLLPESLGWRSVLVCYKIRCTRLIRHSLLHWTAYWTIGTFRFYYPGWLISFVVPGRQISAIRYRDQIRVVLAQMFALRTRVLPENRSWVDNYLDKTWFGAVKIVESVLPVKLVPAHVKTKFRAYTTVEEQRIAQRLESVTGVQYNVDSLETLYMVVQDSAMDAFEAMSGIALTPRIEHVSAIRHFASYRY